MHVVASLLSYPPHRFIGSELMTHALLKRLAARGHQVTVVVRDGDTPWEYEGITVTGGHVSEGEFPVLPDGDVVIYHAEYYEESVENWSGRKIAICHNSRIGVELGLYNVMPDLAVMNSETMRKHFRYRNSVVVHPPVVMPDVPVHGDRVTVINMEKTSKIGPFWDVAKRMKPQGFLGIRGGYGVQSIPPYIPVNVDVIDPVLPSEMAEKVWARTAVLMVPSATESWSMVASEAMSHGIPVIAHPLPGLIENMQGVGTWAPREFPQAWVNGITDILRSWDQFSAIATERAQFQAEQHDAEVEVWCEMVERINDAR